MRITRWLAALRQDLVFASRQLRRSPSFTLVAALTLALGIGANSAIFALVDATLLRPLPAPDADRLVMLWERNRTSVRGPVSPLNLVDWRDRTRTFTAMAGASPGVGGMVMSGTDGTSETVPRQWVTAGFFDVLGVRPLVGRTFLPTDESQRANVVVMTEGLWRSHFAADPAIVGRDIRFDGVPYTVVGVVPDESQLLGKTGIWAMVPIVRRPELRTAYGLRAIGRVKPGVAIAAARADVEAVAAGLAREFPATNQGRSVDVEPLHDALIGSDLRQTSLLFLGVVGFVLLICCANVANLLLARATVRSRELAIRAAMGASRRRIIRQLLTESLLLSVVGGLLGVGVGAAILAVAPSIIPEGLLPGVVTITFDLRVVAFCALAALLVGVLFGLAPASNAADLSSTHIVTSDTRTATGRSGLRTLLVIGEIATAVLLLFGAGLLLRTLLVVEGVDRGYRAEHILTMLVDPLGARYPTPASLLQFYESVEHEIRAVAGVRSVAWASTLPLGESYAGRTLFEIVGEQAAEESQRPTSDYQIVSPTYFETLDLPLMSGRAFSDRDTRDSPPVCIVNETFVQRHVQGRSPLGVRVALRSNPRAQPVVREIVGVARQVKGRPDESEPFVQVYVPLAQNLVDDIFLLVRPASGRAEALASSVRAAIGRADRDQLVSVRDVRTLEDVASEATSRHRFRAVLVITFAALALILAMVGVFGILAYSVQQRARDFGVRRAIGASTADVLRLVIADAVRVSAIGLAVGLALSTLLGRVLGTMLVGVQPLDAMTFAVVPIVMAITAVGAMAGPAWRAARIDPAIALRVDH
jgi:putative ABC transport system permease protein